MKRCLVSCLLSLAACTGGLHARGEQRLTLQANYGDPITDNALGYRGGGNARNLGASAAFEYFVADRMALTGGVGYRFYDQSDGPVHAVEFEVGARHFLFEVGDVVFSFDVIGGLMFGSGSIPEEGTAHNVLLGFGPTVEIALDASSTLLFGVRFRHLSNGRGRSARDNPTQNEYRVFVGVALKW